jgi:hypothetical protein
MQIRVATGGHRGIETGRTMRLGEGGDMTNKDGGTCQRTAVEPKGSTSATGDLS